MIRAFSVFVLFFFAFFSEAFCIFSYIATNLISLSYIWVFTRKGMLSPFRFALFSEISDTCIAEVVHSQCESRAPALQWKVFRENHLVFTEHPELQYVLVLWFCFLMFMYKICFPCLHYIHISLNYCAQCCHVCSSLRKRLMLLSLCELFTEFVKQDVWICLSRKGLMLSDECWINSGLCKLRLICSPRPGWDISNFLYLWNM